MPAKKNNASVKQEKPLYVSERHLEMMKKDLEALKEALKNIREQMKLAKQDGEMMTLDNHSSVLSNLNQAEINKKAQIEALEDDIRRSKIKSSSPASDTVDIGDLVTFKSDYNDGEGAIEQTFVLVSTLTNQKENGWDEISTDCPVGASILGRKIGETITVNLPLGDTVDIVIISKCSEHEQVAKKQLLQPSQNTHYVKVMCVFYTSKNLIFN